jgi:hypothetical protein
MKINEFTLLKQILATPIIFLQLLDYHNQFHLAGTGLSIAFLNG